MKRPYFASRNHSSRFSLRGIRRAHGGLRIGRPKGLRYRCGVARPEGLRQPRSHQLEVAQQLYAGLAAGREDRDEQPARTAVRILIRSPLSEAETRGQLNRFAAAPSAMLMPERRPERRLGLPAGRVEHRRAVDVDELHRVQHIVNLGSGTGERGCRRRPEILEDGQVPVVDARPLDGVARRVAVVAAAGRARERGRVEPAGERIAAAVHRIAVEHRAHVPQRPPPRSRALTAFAAGEVEVVGRGERSPPPTRR